jgi:Uri superfamily endonuclease
MKGTYVLLLKLERDSRVGVGRLGILEFRKGWYAYVGSGMGSLEKRIERHFSKEKKRYWHIDYLLEKGRVSKVIYFGSGKMECKLAEKLAGRFEGVSGFGCSDCPCRSHLFYSGRPVEKEVVRAIRSLRGLLSPLRIWKAGAS